MERNIQIVGLVVGRIMAAAMLVAGVAVKPAMAKGLIEAVF